MKGEEKCGPPSAHHNGWFLPQVYQPGFNQAREDVQAASCSSGFSLSSQLSWLFSLSLALLQTTQGCRNVVNCKKKKAPSSIFAWRKVSSSCGSSHWPLAHTVWTSFFQRPALDVLPLGFYVPAACFNASSLCPAWERWLTEKWS